MQNSHTVQESSNSADYYPIERCQNICCNVPLGKMDMVKQINETLYRRTFKVWSKDKKKHILYVILSDSIDSLNRLKREQKLKVNATLTKRVINDIDAEDWDLTVFMYIADLDDKTNARLMVTDYKMNDSDNRIILEPMERTFVTILRH